MIFHRNLNATITESRLILEYMYLTENPVLFKAQTIGSSQFVRIRLRHLCLISSSILVASPTILLLKVNIEKLELITFFYIDFLIKGKIEKPFELDSQGKVTQPSIKPKISSFLIANDFSAIFVKRSFILIISLHK